jgi:hypothetical protein
MTSPQTKKPTMVKRVSVKIKIPYMTKNLVQRMTAKEID